jgi:thioredoxin reductase
MAAELKLCQPNQKVTLIHSRDKLLSSEPLPDDFKDRSLLALQEAGVDVILGQRVISTIAVEENDSSPIYNLTLKNGKEITTGYVIEAISRSIPSTSYLPEVALDSEGYVKIGPTYDAIRTFAANNSHLTE